MLPSSLQLEGVACNAPQRERATARRSAAEQAGGAQAADQSLGNAVFGQAGVHMCSSGKLMMGEVGAWPAACCRAIQAAGAGRRGEAVRMVLGGRQRKP